MIHHTASLAPPCGPKRDAIYIGGGNAAFRNGWESISTETSVKRESVKKKYVWEKVVERVSIGEHRQENHRSVKHQLGEH
jgi:hypothetical protein